MSGINAFHSDKMLHGPEVSKDLWAQRVGQISEEWRQLSDDDRQAWEKEAEFQQQQRDSLLLQPLHSKREFIASGLPKEDMHGFVHSYLGQPNLKRFCEKASCSRLRLNYLMLESAKEFRNHGLGLQDIKAGLGRDLINLDVPDDEVQRSVDPLFDYPPQRDITSLADTEAVHHQTCFHKFGCCKKTAFAQAAVDLTALSRA